MSSTRRVIGVGSLFIQEHAQLCTVVKSLCLWRKYAECALFPLAIVLAMTNTDQFVIFHAWKITVVLFALSITISSVSPSRTPSSETLWDLDWVGQKQMYSHFFYSSVIYDSAVINGIPADNRMAKHMICSCLSAAESDGFSDSLQKML